MLNRERIEKILATCEGVTPGPYEISISDEPKDGVFDYVLGTKIDGEIEWIAEVFGCVSETDFPDAETTAKHFGRCDPDTIRSLCELALKGLEFEKVRDALAFSQAVINEQQRTMDAALQPEDTQ